MEFLGAMIFLGVLGFIVYCFFVYMVQYKSIQSQIEEGDLIEEIAMDDDLVLVEDAGIRAMMTVKDADMFKTLPRGIRREYIKKLANKSNKITPEEALLKAQQIRDGYKEED